MPCYLLFIYYIPVEEFRKKKEKKKTENVGAFPYQVAKLASCMKS